MSSIAAVAIVVAVMVRMVWIRPPLGLIVLFVLVSFCWRLFSSLYIDAFGPLFSEQLERDIGPGMSTVVLAISQGIVVAAFLFSFRRSRLQNAGPRLTTLLPPGRIALSDIAFWLSGLFCMCLWIELLFGGPIPLFAAMERYDYARLYGGFFHHRLLEWGPMLVFQLGIFFSVPGLDGRSFDCRFAAILGIILLYLFLCGHRFSSFYLYSLFFVIPIGVVLLARREVGPGARAFGYAKALRTVVLLGVVLVAIIAIAIVNSYTVVRGFHGDQLLTKLTQRILVQQGEMWWMTYERVFTESNWDGALAAHRLFVNPFDPSKNSTMQLLMELALPLDRARAILQQGTTYAGGWPEVFFEMGGPLVGFVLVALSAFALSEAMFLMAWCIVEERFATCVFLAPIMYALLLTISSGMVNSFIQVTFVIKALIAAVVYVTEDRWRSSLVGAPCVTSTDASRVEANEARI